MSGQFSDAKFKLEIYLFWISISVRIIGAIGVRFLYNRILLSCKKRIRIRENQGLNSF
jgi:hypothetical protein